MTAERKTTGEIYREHSFHTDDSKVWLSEELVVSVVTDKEINLSPDEVRLLLLRLGL